MSKWLIFGGEVNKDTLPWAGFESAIRPVPGIWVPENRRHYPVLCYQFNYQAWNFTFKGQGNFHFVRAFPQRQWPAGVISGLHYLKFGGENFRIVRVS